MVQSIIVAYAVLPVLHSNFLIGLSDMQAHELVDKSLGVDWVIQ